VRGGQANAEPQFAFKKAHNDEEQILIHGRSLGPYHW